MSWHSTRQPLDAADRLAIGHTVAMVDPLIKTVSGYQRKLAGAVRHAQSYCTGLVASLPDPIAINARAFAADPLVHALFATAEDIGTMLGKSQALKEFIADPACASREAGEFYALLGMRRREKNVMGMRLQGDMVRADTPQTLLYFSDHTLRELSRDIGETRRRLRLAAYDGLVQGCAVQLAQMRGERQQLHDEWTMLRARASMRPAVAFAAIDRNQPDSQRLVALEQRLRQANAELMPQNVLDRLVSWLNAPVLHLRVEPTQVCVDRMGVMTHDTDDGQVSTLDFCELIGRDRRHWTVLLVRIACEEALRAVEQQQETNRYLVI